MARTISNGAHPAPVQFPFHSIRSVTSPEDQEAGRRRYCGVAPANSFFSVNTDENVRGYLGRDEEGARRKSPQVNMRIRETVAEDRERFALLNTGVVMCAGDAEVDDHKKFARLRGCSIINGAQTKGVLEDWFMKDHPEDTDYPSVNFELIITDDEDLVADISIARNYQTRVEELSIYGRQGLLDELEKAMKKADATIQLRKKETDFAESYLDTEKLIQVLTALAPSDLPLPSAVKRKDKTPETIYRVYAYRHRSRCLKDFAHVMDKEAWDTVKGEDWSDAKRFFLDVAVEAWRLYERVKGEQSFSSLHCVKGETIGGRKQVSPDGVPDGVVFPMISALSVFVKKARGGYRFSVPGLFPWATLFEQARVVETRVAGNNPNTMGKSAGCYVALHGLISMYGATSAA